MSLKLCSRRPLGPDFPQRKESYAALHREAGAIRGHPRRTNVGIQKSAYRDLADFFFFFFLRVRKKVCQYWCGAWLGRPARRIRARINILNSARLPDSKISLANLITIPRIIALPLAEQTLKSNWLKSPPVFSYLLWCVGRDLGFRRSGLWKSDPTSYSAPSPSPFHARLRWEKERHGFFSPSHVSS
jgi:hypothetical protein